jgi:hypothetical protein
MKIEFADLRQRHVVAWEKHLGECTDATTIVISAWAAEIVKAAILAGWLVSPAWEVADIDEQTASEVRELAQAVTAKHDEVTTISPS